MRQKRQETLAQMHDRLEATRAHAAALAAALRQEEARSAALATEVCRLSC